MSSASSQGNSMTPAILALVGALIGAGTTLLTGFLSNKWTRDREIRKHTAELRVSLLMGQLMPNVYEPLLTEFRLGQRRFDSNLPLAWEYKKIRSTLQDQRFLVLLTPQAIRKNLELLEQQIGDPQLSQTAREQRVRERLQELEGLLAKAYSLDLTEETHR